jgi:hypothetical protein
MASLMASEHMSVRQEGSQILDTPQAIGGFNGPVDTGLGLGLTMSSDA